jgi:hypothetical protein
MVARGKGYLTNRQLSPSSLLPSSVVPSPTNDDNIGGAATENIAIAVTRSAVDVKCHDFAKDGTKATDATCSCDETFSFPRFDVLHFSPDDHHYLDDADQVIFYF